MAFHPTDGHVCITNGGFSSAWVDALDPAKTMRVAAGDAGTITAKMHRFASPSVAAELRIRAEGLRSELRKSRGRSQH
jgi:hypothetical protein